MSPSFRLRYLGSGSRIDCGIRPELAFLPAAVFLLSFGVFLTCPVQALADKEDGGGGQGDRVTAYHALLIANDELIPDNDMIENALLNWNSWKNNGTITKLDGRTGAQMIADINAWVAGIDGDDVAVFFYGGHGGIRADAGPDEAPPPEANRDPGAENDENLDAQGRRQFVDEVMGLNGADEASHRVDDAVKAALGALPSTTTLVAIFDMCHANGNCLGSEDSDRLTNIAVFNSAPEGRGHAIDHAWPTSLARTLFDTDADTFAQADANHDGEVKAGEWWVEAARIYPRDCYLCFNFDQAADRPIATGLNNEKTPPGLPGQGAGKQGFDGTGICSGFDFGDAEDGGTFCPGPTGYVRRYYQTTLANDGPRYNEWVLQWLGPIVGTEPITDSEENGQPSCNADGDGADEDAVTFLGSQQVRVTVSVDYPSQLDYRLDAWWDRNDNGIWDVNEHVINSQLPYDGASGGLLPDLYGTPTSFEFVYTLGFDPSSFYSRYRLTFGVSQDVEILPYGEFQSLDGASHGEVEDYSPQQPTKTEERSWGRIKIRYR